MNSARLGVMTAGIIGWITLGFWLIYNMYTVSGYSLIVSSPNMAITVRISLVGL
jgi:hypothetical protein